MSEEVITVTEAARNFSDCINRVRYQGTTFVLHKNGVPVARVVPEERKSCTGREIAAALRKDNTGRAIAEALAKSRLTDEEFAEWRHDLKAAREMLLPPVDKWQS